MEGIFISYRRDDASGYARLLYERLAREFGSDQIFMDVEAMREPGMDFVEALEGSVGQCAALLALIGNNWLASTDRHDRRRLDNPEDFVRAEIAAALERDTRVIPILVQGARMPEADELPDNLALLARRQALKLSHEDWEHDVGKLIAALEKLPQVERRPAPDTSVSAAATAAAPVVAPPPPRGKTARYIAIAAAATFVFALAALFLIGIPSEQSETGVVPGGQGLLDIDAAQSNTGDTRSTPARRDAAGSGPSAADVRYVQESLATLGYEPGPADGVMGAGTRNAIREFQDDEGLVVTGSISPELRALLARAVREELDDAMATVVQTTKATAAPLNITGTWYDDNNIPVYIEHTGNNIRVGEFNVFTQQFMPIGAGTLQNGRFTVQYTNSLGQSGTVTAQLDPDGRHLRGTDTDYASGYVTSNTWHHEHLPGQ